MSDLSTVTREMVRRTIVDTVMLEIPLLTMLLMRNRVSIPGGTQSALLVKKQTGESTAQSYNKNDGLTSTKIDRLHKPVFGWKRYQVPMSYDVDDLEQQRAVHRHGELLRRGRLRRLLCVRARLCGHGQVLPALAGL